MKNKQLIAIIVTISLIVLIAALIAAFLAVRLKRKRSNIINSSQYPENQSETPPQGKKPPSRPNTKKKAPLPLKKGPASSVDQKAAQTLEKISNTERLHLNRELMPLLEATNNAQLTYDNDKPIERIQSQDENEGVLTAFHAAFFIRGGASVQVSASNFVSLVINHDSNPLTFHILYTHENQSTERFTVDMPLPISDRTLDQGYTCVLKFGVGYKSLDKPGNYLWASSFGIHPFPIQSHKNGSLQPIKVLERTVNGTVKTIDITYEPEFQNYIDGIFASRAGLKARSEDFTQYSDVHPRARLTETEARHKGITIAQFAHEYGFPPEEFLRSDNNDARINRAFENELAGLSRHGKPRIYRFPDLGRSSLTQEGAKTFLAGHFYLLSNNPRDNIKKFAEGPGGYKRWRDSFVRKKPHHRATPLRPVDPRVSPQPSSTPQESAKKLARFMKNAGFRQSEFIAIAGLSTTEIDAIKKEFRSSNSGFSFPNLARAVTSRLIKDTDIQEMLSEFKDRMTPGARNNLEQYVDNGYNGYKDWYRTKTEGTNEKLVFDRSNSSESGRKTCF